MRRKVLSQRVNPSSARVVVLGAAVAVVIAATVYGLAKQIDQVDGTSQEEASQADSNNSGAQPAQAVPGEVQPLGPNGETTSGDQVETPVESAVLGFRLIDRTTGIEYGILTRNETITRSDYPGGVTIEAIVTPDTEKVIFYVDLDYTDDEYAAKMIEAGATAPYDILSFDSWLEETGTYQLTANTYRPGSSQSGQAYSAVIVVV